MPKTVVVTNDIIFRNYVTKNEKRDLLKRLEKERYIKVAVFRPNTSIFQFFGSDVDYYLSGLFAAPITTSIYKQNSITR